MKLILKTSSSNFLSECYLETHIQHRASNCSYFINNSSFSRINAYYTCSFYLDIASCTYFSKKLFPTLTVMAGSTSYLRLFSLK